MPRVRKIAEWAAACAGSQRLLAAACAGAISAAALPPFFLFPLLFPAFMLLLWLLEGCRTKRQAFFTGWSFGFGHHVAGLYWISISLLVEPDKFAWLIPFAVSAIPAACAVYVGLVTLVLSKLKATGWRKVAMFAALWTLAEMLRARLFSGFPWNLIGYSWGFSDAMSQMASVTGIYGLSFLAILAASMPILLERKQWRPVAFTALAVVIIGAGGAWRLATAPQDMVAGIRLRIVQGNIPQTDKWDYNSRMANLQRYMELSRGEGFDKINYVIWPESAVPYILDANALVLSRLKLAAPKDGFLLTGAVRQPEGEPNPNSYPTLWNSLFAIDAEGHVRGVYDKVHLVPFGEFIPFNKILPLQKITHGMLDFTPGPGPATLSITPLPSFSPLICYEAIFPGEVSNPHDRPHWLLNITNDAWFGVSSGPYQHLEAARFRAIEEGVPMIRAANTGISAVFDAYGRKLARLPLNHEGVLDVALPDRISAPTLYSQAGTAPLSATLLLLTLGLMVKRERKL